MKLINYKHSRRKDNEIIIHLEKQPLEDVSEKGEEAAYLEEVKEKIEKDIYEQVQEEPTLPKQNNPKPPKKLKSNVKFLNFEYETNAFTTDATYAEEEMVTYAVDNSKIAIKKHKILQEEIEGRPKIIKIPKESPKKAPDVELLNDKDHENLFKLDDRIQNNTLTFTEKDNLSVKTVQNDDLKRSLNHAVKEGLHKDKEIFFLKTHKTGSSTFQNILLRYGEKNHLNFALPKSTTAHVYNYNVKFAPWMVREFKTDKTLPASIYDSNILCNHLRFDYKGVASLMDHDNQQKTLYLSIIRDPVSHFKSIFSYYMNDVNAFKAVQKEFPNVKVKDDVNFLIHKFLDEPFKYVGREAAGHYEHLCKNAMAYDFGIDDVTYNALYSDSKHEKDEENSIYNTEKINNLIADYKPKIQQTLNYFHFILNMNYFDESLVLLQNILQWPWEDLAFIKKNSRIISVKQQENELKLTDKDIVKLLKWNYLDKIIYDSVNETFWRQVENFGNEKLKNGLNELRKARYKVTSDCIDHDKSDPQSSYKYSSTGVQIQKYELLKDKTEDESCLNLIMEERKYLYKILYKQTNDMSKEK